MKVLIACEESQRVCIAFRVRGHEAYSCDIQDCSGGHPEWHIKGDALEAIRGGTVTTCDGLSHDIGKWDLLIAHPPCTYLSNAGACRLYPHKGKLDMERYRKGLAAKAFFLAFLNADIPRVAVENPVSSKIFDMPEHTQEIQPYQFGHPYTKKTRLAPQSAAANADECCGAGSALCAVGHRTQGQEQVWRGATRSGCKRTLENIPRHS